MAPAFADRLPVEVLAADLCGRFSGRIVRGVDTRARTPGWMVERLARCGQRSVTALVDISNYVMFEYGRPSHIVLTHEQQPKIVLGCVKQLADGLNAQVLAAQVIPASNLQPGDVQVADVVRGRKIGKRGLQSAHARIDGAGSPALS